MGVDKIENVEKNDKSVHAWLSIGLITKGNKTS